MSQKSLTCIGKKTGRPLTEYESEAEASDGAQHASRNYGRELSPYICDECGMWHLSPPDRNTPSYKCDQCTGTDGRAKDAYPTQEQAQRRADILRQEQGADLRVYVCKHGNGWHLTRSFR